MNNEDQVKNKNTKILKIINLLKRDYVNNIHLKNLDIDPKHFVDEHQFIRYMMNNISRFDGHFYEPHAISYKYYTPWVYNPKGCVCIDVNKMYDYNIGDIAKGYNTVVLDLRAMNPRYIRTAFLASLAMCFSCVRDSFIDDQLIAKYIHKDEKNNETTKYEKDYFNVYDYNNKLTQAFKLNKLQKYTCDKVICISMDNSINTMVLNAMGIPIYTENDNVIDNILYDRYKITKHTIIVPVGRIDCDSEYKYNKGIPEKYYPLT